MEYLLDYKGLIIKFIMNYLLYLQISWLYFNRVVLFKKWTNILRLNIKEN